MDADSFDLEHFPENEVAQRLLMYVTRGWYNKSYIGKWIYEIIGQELSTAINYVYETQNQAFPSTATWGLYFHETMYGIPVNQRENLDDRRRRISKYCDRTIKSPLNPYRIESILLSVYGLRSSVKEYCGKYTIAIDLLIDLEYLVSVEYILNVVQYIRSIKPSHLAVLFKAVVEQIRCLNKENAIARSLFLKTSCYFEKNEKIIARMQLPLPEMDYSEDIDVILVKKKDVWYLNGSVLLDGSKQLNALEEKEKL